MELIEPLPGSQKSYKITMKSKKITVKPHKITMKSHKIRQLTLLTLQEESVDSEPEDVLGWLQLFLVP